MNALLAISNFALILSAHAAPSPAPSLNGPISTSLNVTGSLGSLCSSQSGIQSAIQGVVGNQDSAGLNVTIPANLTDQSSISQLAQIAWEYIITYPLPIVAKTLAGSGANGTAINRFTASSDHLSDYRDSGVVAPNHDTIYSSAVLDLSQGPQIFSIPQFDTPQRYWLVPFLDAYTNYWGGIGSLLGNVPGDYLVVGRNAGANATYGNFTAERILFAPTDINWVILRVLVFNDSDTARAVNYSNAIRISSYNPAVNGSLNATSKAALISRAVNGSGFGPYGNSVGFLSGFAQQSAQWFNTSAQYLNIDPPANGSTAQLVTTINSLAQNASSNSGTTASAFQVGLQVARKCILGPGTGSGLITNTGWSLNNQTGVYGSDYLRRAQDAAGGLGALPASQVIYLATSTDSLKRPLDSSTGAQYTVNFSLPVPAGAFWSLTIYNASNILLFQNPIDRYTISDRTAGLVYSGTNNTTLQAFISATAPAAGSPQYANWLPAPTNAPFELILRVYGPSAAVVAGQYAPPAVVRVTEATTSSAGR